MSNGTIEIRTHVHEQKGTSGKEIGKTVGKKFQLSAKSRRYTYLTAWMFGTDEEIAKIAAEEQKDFNEAKIEVIF